MNFVQLLNSLDELLYELMSWIVFFPVTLWRIIRHPLGMMTYAEEQLLLPPEQQYRATVSPPILLILAVLLGQVIDLALHGTNPIVKSQHGLATLVNDNTTLLLLRILLFGMFPLVIATRFVRRSQFELDRDTLKRPYYAQCFAIAPVTLAMTLGFSLAFQPTRAQQIAGLALMGFAFIFYVNVQTRWFRRKLGQSIPRSLLDAGAGLAESFLVTLLLGLLFAL